MIEENKAGGFLGATTVAEGLRVKQIHDGVAAEGREGGDQFSIREMNPGADTMGGPREKNISQTRRVQQPKDDENGDPGNPGEDPDDKAKREKAEEFFRRKMFGDRPKAKQAADQDQTSNDDQKPPADDTSSNEPKTGRRATKVTKPRRGLTAADAETIATAAATAAVKAIQQPVTEADKRVAASDGPPELEDLEDRDKHAYQIAVRMAKNNPDYVDLPKQMVELGKRKKEYREAWLSENKGQKFSWSDPDHSNFLNQVTPEFNTNDFDEARIDLRVEQATKQERERSEERIREIELKTMEGNLGAMASEETSKSLPMLVEALAPNADWDLSTEEGRKVVEEEEPVLGEIAATHAKYLHEVNGELVKIFDARDSSGRSMYRIDDKKPIHSWIRETVDRWESVFAKSDPSKTTNDNGQTFVTRAQYLKLPESKRDDHWTILRDQTFYIIAKEIANRAAALKEKEVSRLKALAQRNKWAFDPESIVSRIKGKVTRQQVVSRQHEIPKKQREKDDFSGAPSASTGSRIDTQNGRVTPSNEKFVDMMMSKLFPRSRE